MVAWIQQLTRQDLSSQQAVDYIRNRKSISLHHETTCQLICADKAEGGDRYTHLRTASKCYRKHYRHYECRRRILKRVGIEDQPAFVEMKSRKNGFIKGN